VNIFDLKGSSVDRESPADAGTLKDTNFKNLQANTKLYNLDQKHAIIKN
jgi:hypothetical protein